MRNRLPETERCAFQVTHGRDAGHAINVVLVDNGRAELCGIGYGCLDVFDKDMWYPLVTTLFDAMDAGDRLAVLYFRKLWPGAMAWAVQPMSGP